MSTEIILTFAVLGITIFLFVSEWLRVDVVALCVMLALPWLGLVEPHEALAGLSSNAVFSIIGVMILGYGVDRSGIMAKVTRPILRAAGSSERRLVSLVSVAVGAISAFMQNIGAAALFLPALLRIAKRTGLPESRLLMPVGFAAILGGTLTMVASGPLIILNDILRQGGLDPFGLFAVTPVGLTLLIAGILYFLILGPVVLPGRKDRGDETSPQQELVDTWNLASQVTTATVADQSRLIGKTVEEVGLWATYGVNLLLLREGGDVQFAPWRLTRFAAGQELVLLGASDQIARFAADHGLESDPKTPEWLEAALSTGGFAELVVVPRAPLAGKSLRDFAFRKTYSVEPIVLLAPLVMIVGEKAGVDGRALALLVAVCASNSFVLPTHQVNALFMSPGGYRNADYIRAGGIMSLLFLALAVGTVWLLFV